MRGFTTIDKSKIWTRGEGVQKPENFADVLYVWSLREPLGLFSENTEPLDIKLIDQTVHHTKITVIGDK